MNTLRNIVMVICTMIASALIILGTVVLQVVLLLFSIWLTLWLFKELFGLDIMEILMNF